MQNITTYLFDTSKWPPRWYCGQWTSGLGWTHIISDTLIFLAYIAIPCALLWSCRRVQGLKLERIFILFALFIVFCGTGHLLEAIIFYQPIYRFAGLWKALTAAISWMTVIALAPYLKLLLNAPKLEVMNKELREQLDSEQKKLKVAYEEIKINHKILEEFSYRIAHDLKEPIRGISIYTTLIGEFTDVQLPKKAEEYIGKMSSLSKQSLKMIDEILGYCTLPIKEKSLVEVESMLQDLLEEIPNPNQDIHITLSKDLPNIYGNATTLRELFRNLIVNAIKYNDKNEKRVDIGYKKEKDCIVFSIEDNGNGIPKNEIGSLFDFSKGQRIRSKNSGTGFGLMIVKKALDEHNAKVKVVSEPNEGSTFYLSIPNESSHVG